MFGCFRLGPGGKADVKTLGKVNPGRGGLETEKRNSTAVGQRTPPSSGQSIGAALLRALDYCPRDQVGSVSGSLVQSGL